jgi:hypothetical protein
VLFRSILTAIGAAALALGLLVYASTRDARHSLLLPSVSPLAGLISFGAAGGWLPSFVHPVAFGLWSAAALPARHAAGAWACVAWGAVNLLFEGGQHPAVAAPLTAALLGNGGARPSAAAQVLAGYFAQGRFDPLDMVAAVAGSATAVALLRLADRRSPTRST